MSILDRLNTLIALTREQGYGGNALWDINDIAKYYKCEKRTAENIAKSHGFPVPIRAPIGEKLARKRWRKQEVIDYFLRQR